MKLTWIGHACFQLTAQDGTVVITDPYDESVGIDMIPLEARLITMSHDHHDHCERSTIVGSPMIARGLSIACVGSVFARAVRSYHDEEQGAKRGENYIRIFAVDGLKVVHMGDQGCMPDDAVIEKIKGADIMLIPVGGTYTVDAKGAKAIIERAKPRCAVPMHVKTARCPYPIAPVTDFLKEMDAEGLEPIAELEAGAGDALPAVALLAPQADALW